MAFSFGHGVEEALRDRWAVSSRGTKVAARGSAICDISASLIDGDDDGQAFAHAHRSTPLTAAHIARQDILLVASQAERAAVARLSPDARSKAFTLREAVALGAEPFTSGELELVRKMREGGSRGVIGSYAAILHARRGLVAEPGQQMWRAPWRRSTSHAFDIPDVHHLTGRRHVATLRELQADVVTFRQQVVSYLAHRAV